MLPTTNKVKKIGIHKWNTKKWAQSREQSFCENDTQNRQNDIVRPLSKLTLRSAENSLRCRHCEGTTGLREVSAQPLPPRGLRPWPQCWRETGEISRSGTGEPWQTAKGMCSRQRPASLQGQTSALPKTSTVSCLVKHLREWKDRCSVPETLYFTHKTYHELFNAIVIYN